MIIFYSTKELDVFLEGSPSYYNDDKDMPILEKISKYKKRVYSIEEIVKLLLNPNLRSSKFIATKVPNMVCSSVSFVVNLDSLDTREDITADDMGVWRNNGTDKSNVEVIFHNNSIKEVKKCSSIVNSYTVKRVYRTHSTDRTLRKTTAFIYSE